MNVQQITVNLKYAVAISVPSSNMTLNNYYFVVSLTFSNNTTGITLLRIKILF